MTQEATETFADSHGRSIFKFFLCLTKFFFSLQVKRNMIISNKYVMYKLPHKISKQRKNQNLRKF